VVEEGLGVARTHTTQPYCANVSLGHAGYDRAAQPYTKNDQNLHNSNPGAPAICVPKPLTDLYFSHTK